MTSEGILLAHRLLPTWDTGVRVPDLAHAAAASSVGDAALYGVKADGICELDGRRGLPRWLLNR